MKNQNSGFTLIEMIVAVGVFSVAITMSLASFLNISAIQKKAEAFRAINNNLNFAMETMVREIKTGSDYNLNDDLSLKILNSSSEFITFSLSNGQIKRQEGEGEREALALTAPETEITNLEFILKTSPQPMVTILLNGVIKEKGEIKSRLNLQTTVSQRKLE